MDCGSEALQSMMEWRLLVARHNSCVVLPDTRLKQGTDIQAHSSGSALAAHIADKTIHSGQVVRSRVSWRRCMRVAHCMAKR